MQQFQRPRASMKRTVIGFSLLLLSGVTQASIISGNINTLLSSSNQSTDGLSYFNAPTSAPFSLVTIGEYDLNLTSNQMISAGTFSGNFGSNIIGSSTAPVNLFIDGIAVATCDATCAANSASNDVSWSYTLSTTDLTALASNTDWTQGKVILTALQTDVSQIALDPTSFTLTRAVPVPGAALLFSSALAFFLSFSSRKNTLTRA
ncbi:hypothetical protein [Methylomonas sp. AM2-LC]|uniref:hypothetical protein n=1 Tax=Methylomonas sp. AM2-LC TaxID=3153301 RepID=UPI0032640DFF